MDVTYIYISPVGDEVSDLCDPELLDLCGEGKVVPEVRNLSNKIKALLIANSQQGSREIFARESKS